MGYVADSVIAMMMLQNLKQRTISLMRMSKILLRMLFLIKWKILDCPQLSLKVIIPFLIYCHTVIPALQCICIGLHHLLNSNPGLLDHDGEQSDYSCRIDTGTAKKLRRWSRGH